MGLKRTMAIGLVAVGAALAATPPALAREVTVTATPGLEFSPQRVGISPGDAVVWRNGGGIHNVRFDDGGFEEPAEPSSESWTTIPRAFPGPARLAYHCELHGSPNGVGMAGEVIVGRVGEPPPDVRPPRLRAARLRTPPGALVMSFRTDEAGRATVRLTKRSGGRITTVRKVVRRVSAGKVRVRFDSSSLPDGRYRATAVVRDGARNSSRAIRAAAVLD